MRINRARGLACTAQGSFDAYVRPGLAAALRERLSATVPNAMQAEALAPALKGQDVLLQAQTGSGKTLTFVLPLLERLTNPARSSDPDAPPLTALILAPTAVLAEQHAATTRALASALTPPVPVGCDTGSGPAPDPSIAPPPLLVATPAGLRRRLASGALARDWAENLSVVAIDECDAGKS